MTYTTFVPNRHIENIDVYFDVIVEMISSVYFLLHLLSFVKSELGVISSSNINMVLHF